jgi:hypothetical protein
MYLLFASTTESAISSAETDVLAQSFHQCNFVQSCTLFNLSSDAGNFDLAKTNEWD